jgi:hypothetical protein
MILAGIIYSISWSISICYIALNDVFKVQEMLQGQNIIDKSSLRLIDSISFRWTLLINSDSNFRTFMFLVFLFGFAIILMLMIVIILFRQSKKYKISETIYKIKNTYDSSHE